MGTTPTHFYPSIYQSIYQSIYIYTCRDGGNTFTPERYRLELNSAHTFTWSQGPTTHTQFVWSFFFEKAKLRARQKRPTFRQRQAHDAVRHAVRSRLVCSVPGHRARTRALAECVCEAESDLESASMYPFINQAIYLCMYPSIYRVIPRPAYSWPLHDIVIANIVRYILQ